MNRAQIVPDRATRHGEGSQQAPLYRVFVHNDDVTPMDFVVHVLLTVFFLPSPNAEYIMYTAHLSGKAYVQTLPRPEAQRRIAKAKFAARLRGFPLELSMEPD